ncbi:tetratricopeptide repeat-containing sensor histidine kinase [Bacteroides intestinalis]|jgi:tetratricopeptide (TPR) repeat protein|uniref:tetratricopeptide repeat-containing sensor histidine kinase n=1 Tax=Bacteroides intestinalis TaxID=329854 RepID=UPI0022E66352|nr:histidine kinase dimerization/phospho-acceptor domain-containing protein [Bacteroides intestinalis]
MRELILILLCVVSSISLAATQDTDDKHLRDSIFLIYQSMPVDTARTQFLKDVFVHNIDKDWSAELLDSALTSAINMKDVESELALRYEYFRYYTFRLDGENMDKALVLLKEVCYRCKIYDNYFSALHYMLQLKGSRGDTESAILESQKMREEAIRLKDSRGVFLSYVTEGKAYVFARNYEKAIECYKKATELTPLSTEDELMVHQYLTSAYYLFNKHPEMIAELETQRRIIDGIIKEQPAMLDSYRSKILEIELMYCKIYLAVEDAPNLKKHLDEAAKFYNDDSFLSTVIAYNFSWAGYYYITKDWDKCFPQFELTLSAFKGTQPMYEMDIRRIMGDAYVDAGRYKEAAETYRVAVLKCDSINKATLRMNEETVQANYRIQKALLEKEIGAKRFWQIAVGGASLFVILLVWGVLRVSRIYRELAKSEREMRESYAVVKAADKMKEVFLHNITNEIRGPLNSVVTLSDYLCQRNDLTMEQQQEYATIIRQNSEQLINLIFNILDLSRLESGMMKFNVQEYDMVQLCKDAKMRVELEEGNSVQLDFLTDLNTLLVQVDTARFLKLLSSVLMPLKRNKEQYTIEYTLFYNSVDELKIVVTNSPLLMDADNEREREIQHAINRLYLETFQGGYQLCEEDGKQLIIITYPIK